MPLPIYSDAFDVGQASMCARWAAKVLGILRRSV